ncbi:hypothetical protein KEM52_000252 [Ascosphaera acerosa]|nr:hypothetical protein KEM52_000252 [Ascosphaera acerosa]
MEHTAMDAVIRLWERQQKTSPVYAFLLQNVQITDASPGRFVAQIRASSEHMNSHNGLHGVFSACVTDWAGGMAIATHGWQSTGVSVDIHVTYLTAAQVGDLLEIEATADKIGSQMAFTTINISKIVDDGRVLVAKGSHTKFVARAQSKTLSIMSSAHYEFFPIVRPSAIVLGIMFNELTSLKEFCPLITDTRRRASAASSKEDFLKSKEAGSALGVAVSTLCGSALKAYAIASLIDATRTVCYKGAIYVGTMVFVASSAPTVVSQIFIEKKPVGQVMASEGVRAFESIGLCLIMNWWGVRTSPLIHSTSLRY